ERSLSDKYWLNISDPDFSFGGVIEHTNLVPKRRYGTHLVYLFSYVPAEHEIYNLSDKALFERYYADLKRIFPSIKKNDIRKYHVNRATHANPVFETPFLPKMPKQETPVSGLYLLDMTQIYPQDRNVSHSIALAKEFVEENL
ncbi:amine oxidase, partial [Candidatus Fermentibacteria bacterium]